jgi:DegV family protein with EDD domain
MSVELFTDSLCDITPDLIEAWKLHVVPLLVYFKGDSKTYFDGEVTPEEIYKIANKGKNIPNTAAVTPEAFIEAFKAEVDKGNKIIYLGCGSGISSTYQNSVIASREFKDGEVTCIDSRQLSTGISLLLHKIRIMIDANIDIPSIVTTIESYIPRLSVKFCVDKMDYLYHGGRCSSLAYIFGSSLHIHPIIQMANNKMTVKAKTRGAYVKALDYQIDEFMKDLPNIDLDCVFITHSAGEGYDAYKYVYEKLKPYVPEGNLHITTSHCVVSSHCGPHTLGILYLLKK